MSSLKGSGLLLLLALPVVGYGALQVKNALHTDSVTSELPPERGGSKEQLAGSRAKSSALLADTRKAATITSQFRAAATEDASTNPDAKAVVTASANRAADLNDLDLFLSEIERAPFTGKLKNRYASWIDERKKLKSDEEAVVAWLGRTHAVTSHEDAAKEMEEANTLIVKYSTRSKFSDSTKAAAWRIKARSVLTDALAQLADTQYRTAVNTKLPLEKGNNAVKVAVETLRGLKAMIRLLDSDAKTAEEEKKFDAGLRAQVDAKSLIVVECTVREELLGLFAKDDLFTNSGGASAWLKQVREQYRHTKDEKVRELIRVKVQEFCEAFIPQTARLDDKVLLKGKPVDRKKVIIKHTPVGKATTREELSGDLDGLNEFNFMQNRSGGSLFVVYDGDESLPKVLEPTELSRAAVHFNTVRKDFTDGTSVPRWTAKSVEQLKKKCEAQKDLVDQLQTLNTSTGTDPKIWTRLTSLAEGIAQNADLFESP